MRQLRFGTYTTSTQGAQADNSEFVPIRRERHGKYAFDVTVEDHRCSTRSQVPHTTNGIKTAGKDHKRTFTKNKS